MTKAVEVVRVAWGSSRSESVRDAWRLRGLDPHVIALPHALNVGPIDPMDPEARRAWAQANLRDDDPCREWHEPEQPWTEATASGARPVCWVYLTDAAAHASFTE